MSKAMEAPGARLRALWLRLSPLPGGPRLFSWLLGRMVPYSGSIGAQVRRFDPGHVVVELPDRRRVRNHLRSVHAIALANVGELSTGLAVLGAMDETVRGILTGLDVTYSKKARGRLRVEVHTEVPVVTDSTDFPVEARVQDSGGDTVAIVRAHWRLGPVPAR
ncbi:MAG: DUF4442 domain-containing protein [Gemmatimonadota bacterium]